VFLLGSVAILLFLGSFYFQLNKGSSTSIAQLPDVPAKAAFITLEREFAGGLTDPAEIVIVGNVSSPEVQSAVTKLQDSVAQDPIFSPDTQVATAPDGSAVKVSAFFKGETQNDASFAAIRDLRDDRTCPRVRGVRASGYVGGNSAIFGTSFGDRLVPVDRAGVRPRSVVPAADGRVPFADPADQASS
jgi:uncharacterized membrane protein YdfJ with MMPL/SSD domain